MQYQGKQKSWVGEESNHSLLHTLLGIVFIYIYNNVNIEYL